MLTQEIPVELQRIHWKEPRTTVGYPLHVPVVEVTTLPVATVPDTTIGYVFKGGPVTIAVWTCGADDEPRLFVAVTITPMAKPTSARVATYVDAVAPEIVAQCPVLVLQRCQA
jgi:hypothetical protein